MLNSIAYFADFVNQVDSVPINEIELVCSLIYEALKQGKTLYVAGNGGSAAMANHFYADLSNELLINKMEQKPRVVSLCDSIARITAIANDYGYEHVFSRQLEHGNKGDVLLLLSVSGESKNLVNAAWEAKKHSMSIVSIVSKKSTLSNISDKCIMFGDKDYGIAEDFQSMFLHLLKRMFNSNKPHRCE
jgi:D-sedoheptulose 7-phosphate isomerase